MSELQPPKNWINAPIGQLCSLINGRAFKPKEWSRDGLPIVRIQNLNKPEADYNYFNGEAPEKFLIQTGNLLFAWSGTPGTSFGAHIWRGEKAWLNQHIFNVVHNTKFLDRQYFLHAINQTLDALIKKSHGGVGLRHVTKSKFEETEIPLPPLKEQKRIVAKIEELFSELDNGEESLRRARRQLGVYRQSLLKQAFEGKLTATWRTQNPDLLESPDQLLQRIQKEREARYEEKVNEWEASCKIWEESGNTFGKPAKPRRLKPSDPIHNKELTHRSELPEAWTYGRLGEAIVTIDAGKSFSCEERPPSIEEIGVAKVSAVTWGEYDEEESKTCRDSSKVIPDYFINDGDFLLSRANTIELVGAVVIVKDTKKKIMLSDKTLRIDFAGCSPEYFLQFLRSRSGRLEIMNRSSGNQESMRNIGQERIASIVTPLCSLPEQQEIVSLLDEQFTVIEQNEREIDAALKRSEALRQSILKKAFSGQLVPQDPDDEPASELLARIRAERALQLEKEATAKATKKKSTKKKSPKKKAAAKKKASTPNAEQTLLDL